MIFRSIPIRRLSDALSYDSESGILTWKYRQDAPLSVNRRFEGKIAGCARGAYTSVCMDGMHIHAHRIAWALHSGGWPEGQLDHVNGDGKDNRICNLRPATSSENLANTRRNSKSGYRGVYWSRENKKWRSMIRKNGKWSFLGHFECKANAALAYNFAALERHGEFATLNT